MTTYSVIAALNKLSTELSRSQEFPVDKTAIISATAEVITEVNGFIDESFTDDSKQILKKLIK